MVDVNSVLGNLNVFYPIGAMLGSILAGVFASSFGRVRTLIGKIFFYKWEF